MLEINQIYNMDCIEGMPLMEAESVDLIITDPPFAIDFQPHKGNYNRTQSRVLTGYNEIKADQYLNFTLRWMRQAYRVLKPSGSMFIFSGWNNLKDILLSADKLNYETVNHIIWKYQFGVVCKRKFVTSHYHCLFLCKDDMARRFFNSSRFSKDEKAENGGSLRYQDLEDVWYIKREYWHGDKKTPTKLPRELIEKILSYTSKEGHLVLDPFLGSGTTALAAKQLSRHYIGIELKREYYELALKELQLPAQPELNDLNGPVKATKRVSARY